MCYVALCFVFFLSSVDERCLISHMIIFQANISRCVTRSTQTFNSHGVYVQATPPQDKEVQTRRDNYTNTKNLKTFIFGLRGRRDDNQHVVSFLEEELEHL